MPRSGLRWVKLDLHVHTPASHDYVGALITPAEFVQAALNAGVRGIAITDHNTAMWVDKMIAAAAATRLAVFPGVEITCGGGKSGGVHVIAIFDRTATAQHVEALLAKLGLPPDRFGAADAIVPHVPEHVITTIHESGALAILAHADSSKGALHDMTGQPRIATMNHPNLAAVEVTNGVKTAPLLNGSDPSYRRALPCYRASDNRRLPQDDGHCASGIGRRFSWFKMDGVTLRGLGQCFADPTVRIRTDESSREMPTSMSPCVRRVTVSQGFLGGISFDFHEGLNSIVGGKGVGKSLLVEVLRFALGDASPIPSVRDDRASKLATQLGRGAVVEVVLRTKAGRELTVRRMYDGESNPAKAVYDDGTEEHGSITALFPILAYSQTEPLDIAREPAAQLALIDSFIEFSPVEVRIETVRKALGESDRAWAACLRAEEEVAALRASIATINAKIAELERALKSPEHDKLAALEPKTRCLSDGMQALDELQEAVEGLADHVHACDLPGTPASLTEDADLAKVIATARGEVRALEREARSFEKRVATVHHIVKQAQDEWGAVVAKETKAYQAWAKGVGGDRAQLLASKAQFAKQQSAAAKQLAVAERVAGKMATVQARRVMLLDELDAATDEVYGLRTNTYARLEAVIGGRLRLAVTRHGRRAPYLQRLKELKHGSRVADTVVEAIATAVLPRKFVELVLAKDIVGIAQRASVSEKATSTLVAFLGSREDLTDLLRCQHEPLVDDEPRIAFRKEDGAYYPLGELSIGQKCTALLIIALSEGDRPVIIDQPEDALDTPSVFEDVTLPMRGRKDERQFIVTTHNSTVAVAGDTDAYLILRATASQAAITHRGALDREPVRLSVIQHLEGGPEPFGLKSRKYGRVAD
jgi:hypothetical protein